MKATGILLVSCCIGGAGSMALAHDPTPGTHLMSREVALQQVKALKLEPVEISNASDHAYIVFVRSAEFSGRIRIDRETGVVTDARSGKRIQSKTDAVRRSFIEPAALKPVDNRTFIRPMEPPPNN